VIENQRDRMSPSHRRRSVGPLWLAIRPAGFAWLYSRLITKRYRPPENFYTGAYVTPNSTYVTVNYKLGLCT